ncbi:hypothetical protein E4U42_005081 [Claviceps africana]|uniref:Haloacid dehalogenase n=1 Tax=Claviceps africana TaxID=83212 RepID=A0A8K0NHL3_9HYPO|nr:hypothetical protein E4U42_005081 [Claviceps africana]
MTKTAIAFDLYGTLLSTESIAGELGRIYGEEHAKTIAAQARRLQLEFTWRSNSMGTYRPFDDLTRHSFRQATAEAKLPLSKDQEERIMDAYNGLDAFTDVDEGLVAVSQAPEIAPYIFSNGTMDMLTASLETSKALAESPVVFSASNVVSVDALKVFKPDPRTYLHMAKTAGMESQPERVYLVSSNPFDVMGAVAAGLSSVWVSRQDAPWLDGLGQALGIDPTAVAGGVDEAVREIIKKEGLGGR